METSMEEEIITEIKLEAETNDLSKDALYSTMPQFEGKIVVKLEEETNDFEEEENDLNNDPLYSTMPQYELKTEVKVEEETSYMNIENPCSRPNKLEFVGIKTEIVDHDEESGLREESNTLSNSKCNSMLEKNTNDSQEERNRKRWINDSSDDEKVKEERNRKNREKYKRYREKKKIEAAALPIKGEERKQKNREKCKRYREKINNEAAALAIGVEERNQKNREKCKRYRAKKNNELAALTIRGSPDSDEKKRKEERKQKAREQTRRYRENMKKKNNKIEVAALSIMEQARQKQTNAEKCKRYRDNKRASYLQSQITSNRKNVPQHTHSSQIASPPTRDAPYVLLSRSIEDTVLQCHPPSQIDLPPPNINLETYPAFQQNSPAHREFERDFVENEFGLPCDICDRLWFKKDLKYLPNNNTIPNIEFITTLLSNTAILEIKVCSTCYTAVKKQRIPPLSVYNGFKYPPVPECLKDFPLDLVTERLVSPMVPFMQIRRLRHVHGQCGIYGQVINVPIEVNTMVNLLPRQVDDDHAIIVHIKRKKIHESSYVYSIIKNRKIEVWLRYLKDTPLYTTYRVSVDDRFLNDKSFEVEEEIVFDEDGDNDILELIPIDDSLVAQQETLMWNDDMYLRIASGEGNVPISLLFDGHAEELSFPQIYLGQFRSFREGISVTPFMMATSELRRADRRGVTPQHLLYMAMKIMRLRIKESLPIASKHVGKGIEITKEQIQSDDGLNTGCIESNLAFLRSIPNSAFYWAEIKRDLFAMIRQYGKPTVFFTISANEMGWPKLLQLLHNLKHNADISAAEAAELHYIQKSTLVNEDAVTCALYFNKLVNILLKILQSKRYSPFRKYRILHYFKRIEFLHRGSPHAHVLAWLDNAPEDALGRDYNQAINLIDCLTSVSASEASSYICLQTHKHSFTCYKGIRTSRRQQQCKFEAPFMPMKKTMILQPMKETDEGFQHYKAKYNATRENLENYEYNDFKSFYSENNIDSDQEYVDIIRAGINRPKVFVKRKPCEKWHNPFNPFMMNVVKSNTDFQFIPDEYSCAAYVVEYVNKTNRGISNLQREIIEIMDEHPEFNISEIVKNISINLLKQTEMTSQEAAWYLLREPMTKSSTIIIYIPTIRPVERQRIKKNMKELSEPDDDSIDIWKENWFDKYEKRPDDLANISLAQFVSKYYKNHKDEYVQREEPRVIRYRNYNMATDYNEYKREMVTLHLPFRNEEADILAEMRYLQLYDENEALLLERRKEFESNLDIQKNIGNLQRVTP